MKDLPVSDIMWSNPPSVSPGASLRFAAERMAALGCGALPVGDDGNLDGIITESDIVRRALGQGLDPRGAFVRDFMTPGVYVCKEFDTVAEAVGIMQRHGVSRLVVLDEENRLSGLLSFDAILKNEATPGEISEIVTHAVGRRAAALRARAAGNA